MIKCFCCFNKLMKTIVFTLLYIFFLLKSIRTLLNFCSRCGSSIKIEGYYHCGRDGKLYDHPCIALCNDPSIEIVNNCLTNDRNWCKNTCGSYISICLDNTGQAPSGIGFVCSGPINNPQQRSTSNNQLDLNDSLQ